MAEPAWKPVPFCDGAYTDDSPPFSPQETVNMLVQNAEAPGTRSQKKIVCVPGLVTVGSPELGEEIGVELGDFVRGGRNVEGTRYWVIGNSFFRQNADHSFTRLGGDIPGAGRVVMVRNQITNGSQIGIFYGSDGWVYNTVDESFTKITDDGFTGFKSADFIDQMVVGTDPHGRHFYPSALAEMLEYQTLEQQEAEAAPDPIQCVLVLNQELLIFGTRTLQAYASTGDPEELFADKKAGKDRGTISRFSPIKLDNTAFFIGDDSIAYRLDGYTPIRISRHSEEAEWSKLDMTKCFSMVWEDRGHKVWYITVPGKGTWGYDCATREWHTRQSYGMKAWRANVLVPYKGEWYVGDSRSTNVYRMDWRLMAEACVLQGTRIAGVEQDADPGQPLVRRRISGVAHNNGNRLTLHGFRLTIDTGREIPSGYDFDLDDHYASVSLSKDGRTFGEERVKDLGAVGDFNKEVVMRRLGIGRWWACKFESASRCRTDILEAAVQAE